MGSCFDFSFTEIAGAVIAVIGGSSFFCLGFLCFVDVEGLPFDWTPIGVGQFCCCFLFVCCGVKDVGAENNKSA